MGLFEIPDTPFALDWDEWENWNATAKKRYPVRWLLSRTIPRIWHRTWNRFVHEPIYWLKCRLWFRYNVVVCRRLPPTWCDRDALLLHASFQLLTDFVEQEKPWAVNASDKQIQDAYEVCGEEECVTRTAQWAEVKALYDWWKSYDFDGDDNYELESSMLVRLIAVRGCLWT